MNINKLRQVSPYEHDTGPLQLLDCYCADDDRFLHYHRSWSPHQKNCWAKYFSDLSVYFLYQRGQS